METNPLVERILIVDDSRSTLQYLKDVLSEQGYAIYSFTIGNQALSWARENTPDLFCSTFRCLTLTDSKSAGT